VTAWADAAIHDKERKAGTHGRMTKRRPRRANQGTGDDGRRAEVDRIAQGQRIVGRDEAMRATMEESPESTRRKPPTT